MIKKNNIFNVIMSEGMSYEVSEECCSSNVTIYKFNLKWKKENGTNNDAFEIAWTVPMIDILYTWSPMCGTEHSILPNWWSCSDTMISSNAPASISYNGKSMSKYAWALSECAKLVQMKVGVVERTGELESFVRLPLKQFENTCETTLMIYVNTTEEPMADAAAKIASWWESIGMTPCSVPEAAKDPVYSFWYSYHQELTAQGIEAECARAKELGFGTCIVDDGWQTDDIGGGYFYCGDWEVGTKKIPDMKAHVERVHKLGMKYIIWYSVPFMGYKAKRFNEFRDMALYDREKESGAIILDPRYKKVRDFLTGIYKEAVIKWNLDGLKLDFIDRWCEVADNAPYNSNMDIPVLQDAVDAFMIQVLNELKAIKDDILIEFRQNYIGPNMRKYGNMFRVADCPNDSLKNRIGVFDLRMMMGNSAVHSDMLMWHKDEAPEIAALQIISVLFSVLQYSARIENIDDATKKMSKFWVGFMKEHKDLLLSGKLSVYEPHLNYTWAKSTLKNKCMVAVYATDKCVKPDCTDTIYIANGSECDRVIVDITGEYEVNILNCYGECVSEKTTTFNGISSINIPIGGLVVLKKTN